MAKVELLGHASITATLHRFSLWIPEHTKAHRRRYGRGLRIKSTAAKPPVERAGYSTFLQVLQVKTRADERTRTADLVSLRVCCRTCKSVLIRPAIWLIYAAIVLSGNVCRPVRSALYQPGCGTVAASFA